MKLRNLLRPALACLALAGVAVLAQTGGVSIPTPGVNAAFTVDVPADAESYQVTVYDHDGWWDKDDVLSSIPTADLAPPKPKSINILAQLVCVGGNVCGGMDTSGEACAEVYVVVTWYPKSAKEVAAAAADAAVEDVKPCGTTESNVVEVCCT